MWQLRFTCAFVDRKRKSMGQLDEYICVDACVLEITRSTL